MRVVSGGNLAQPLGTLTDFSDKVKIEVANAADALVDLTEFAVSLEYDDSVDEIVGGATVVFRRLEGVNSLAPLMTASPPVNIGRRIAVSINAGSGTYKEVFRGKIDDVDWPERFGDVTVQCRDQAGVAADTWIETGREYGSTAGVSLETVMQAVATDNLTSPPTLYFPAPTGAVVQHLDGDPAYGPTEQSTLDALRALAESYGGTIRWRNYDASPSDWKWSVFTPSRTKTIADHTFGTSDYWDVTTIRQSVEDIRNVVEVAWIGEGETLGTVTVSDSASITKYGRRYMKITEGSGSPVNNLTLATALANAALSDLKEPDALLEITGRYFWPGEIGVDLYTFTANNKHFSTDQKLAVMAFHHRIATGERPTTKILTRGKPSGGVLMWRRRMALGSALTLVPSLRVSNFREVARTQTEVTFGWDVAGTITELWLYLSTPAQPVASDPWAALAGAPSVRLTGATTSYTVPIPDAGLVTYGRLVPIDADIARGQSWDFTVQGAAMPLNGRLVPMSVTPTQMVVRYYVANPITGTADVTITYTQTGVTSVSPASPQTIVAANVTPSLDTTGYIEFTITRGASTATEVGRVVFTASSTDRVPDTDAVDVPPQEQSVAQATVSLIEDGSVSIVVDGPAWVASYKYATSLSAFPSDATAIAGTTLEGRQATVTLAAATLALGDSIFATFVPYSGTGATGYQGSSIRARGTRHDFGAYKTVYFGANRLTVHGDPTVYGFELVTGYARLRLNQLQAVDNLQIPDGVTITQVDCDVYTFPGSPTAEDSLVTVELFRISSSGGRTSLGSVTSFEFGGWETKNFTLSESTTGRKYQLYYLGTNGIIPPTVDYVRIAGTAVTYLMPSTINAL